MSFAVLSRKKETAAVSKTKAPSSVLRVGKADDVFEREADRVSDQVVSTGSLSPSWSISRMSIAPPVQRKCGCGGSKECPECREKEIQRETDTASPVLAPEWGDTAPESVKHVLSGSGRQLDSALTADMGERFGYDFSRVRVHSGAAAEQSARDVNAKAYTVGNNIVFGSGRYAPATQQGQRLIAHELTHVVQQQGDAPSAVQRAPENPAPNATNTDTKHAVDDKRYDLQLVVPHLYQVNARTYTYSRQTPKEAVETLFMFRQKLLDIIDIYKGLHRQLRDNRLEHSIVGFWSDTFGRADLPDYEIWDEPQGTLYQSWTKLDAVKAGRQTPSVKLPGFFGNSRALDPLEQIAMLLQIASDKIGEDVARLIEYKEGTEKGAARGVTACKVSIAVLAIGTGVSAAMEFAAPVAFAAPEIVSATATAAPEVIAGTATAAPGVGAATATIAPEVIAGTATAAPGVAAAASVYVSGGALAEEALWSATMRALPRLAVWIAANQYLTLSIVGTTLGIAEARLGTHRPTRQDVSDTLLDIIIGLGHAYEANQADTAPSRAPVTRPPEPSKTPTGFFARLYFAAHVALTDAGVGTAPAGGTSGTARPVPTLVDSGPGADSASIIPIRPAIPADMPDQPKSAAATNPAVAQPTTSASTTGGAQTSPSNVLDYRDPNYWTQPSPAGTDSGAIRLRPGVDRAITDIRDAQTTPSTEQAQEEAIGEAKVAAGAGGGAVMVRKGAGSRGNQQSGTVRTAPGRPTRPGGGINVTQGSRVSNRNLKYAAGQIHGVDQYRGGQTIVTAELQLPSGEIERVAVPNTSIREEGTEGVGWRDVQEEEAVRQGFKPLAPSTLNSDIHAEANLETYRSSVGATVLSWAISRGFGGNSRVCESCLTYTNKWGPQVK